MKKKKLLAKIMTVLVVIIGTFLLAGCKKDTPTPSKAPLLIKTWTINQYRFANTNAELANQSSVKAVYKGPQTPDNILVISAGGRYTWNGVAGNWTLSSDNTTLTLTPDVGYAITYKIVFGNDGTLGVTHPAASSPKNGYSYVPVDQTNPVTFLYEEEIFTGS